MSRIKLSDLTLREKIGQTGTVQSPTIINMESEGKMDEYLKNNPISVWHTCNAAMTAANLEYLSCDEPQDSEFYRRWTKRYKKHFRVPPFIALDPPSGAYASDLPNLPPAPHIGAAANDDYAYKHGKYMALMARSLGANWLWGTEVDMPSRFSASSVCRKISSDLDILTKYASLSMKGGQDTGVVMTTKHFPGADTKEYRDSHFCATINRSSMEEWHALQGEAFKRLIDAGTLSIMVGHKGFPAMDDRKAGASYIPSTVSYNVCTKLLKEELGFKGVVVTDAVDMAALKTIYPSLDDLYVAILNAGVDIVLGVSDIHYIDRVEKAVLEGRIPMERIDDACQRIMDVKEKMGLFDEQEEIVMTPELREEITRFGYEVAESALCLQCDRQNLLPLKSEKIKSVAILCFSHTDYFSEDLRIMKGEFEKRGIKVRLQRRVASYDEMQEIADENDLIIYAAYVAPHAPMGGSGLFLEECRALFYALTAGREKSIGVSMCSPYVYYDYFISMDTYIHTFSRSKNSQIAFVKALFGEIPFKGVYPYEKPWEE